MFICFYGGGRSTLNTELSENDSRKDSFTLKIRKKLQSRFIIFVSIYLNFLQSNVICLYEQLHAATVCNLGLVRFCTLA